MSYMNLVCSIERFVVMLCLLCSRRRHHRGTFLVIVEKRTSLLEALVVSSDSPLKRGLARLPFVKCLFKVCEIYMNVINVYE